MRTIESQVKWGIIGVGDVCEIKSGPAFNKVPDSQLVAVMRRNKEKARDYARRHNVPKFYDSAEELLQDKEVNAIYIATPPAFHEEYAHLAAKAGKPVYIEKPVTLDAASCARLIEISNNLQIRMSVAHYRRRLPLFLKIKELIQNHEIGKVNLIDVRIFQSPVNSIIADTDENWRINPELSGGGLFHDLAPHQLDILCWLFGEPGEVQGHSHNQGKLSNAPDLTFLEASFANDIFLNGVWSFNINEHVTADRCEIYGEKGKISFSFFRNPLITQTGAGGIQQFELSSPEHVQQPLIADVVQYFKGKIPNPSPLNEALWSMNMMDCTLAGSS